MSYTKINIFFAALFFIVPLLFSSAAFGAPPAYTCNNGDISGMRSAHDFKIIGCTFPSGTTRNQMVRDGFRAWNHVYGMYDRFNWNTVSKCSVGYGGPAHTDEVAMVESEYIDGARGVTRMRKKGCFFSKNRGKAEEIDMFFTPSNADWHTSKNQCFDTASSPTTGESVVVHEAGHALGAKHHTGELSIMMNSDVWGHVCHAEGSVAEPYAEDTQFAYEWHSSGNKSKDVQVMNYYHKRGLEITENMDNVTRINRCPGDNINFDFTFQARGTEGFDTSLYVYLSPDRDMDDGDNIIVKTYNIWSTNGGGVYQSLRRPLDPYFTIPSSVEYDKTYFIGFEADPFNKVNEVNHEFNDEPRSPTKVEIWPEDDCGQLNN